MADTAPWLIVAILANYRIARMLAMEDGPFDVFSRLQERVGSKSWIGRGLSCPLCMGFWIALPMALILPISDDWRTVLLLWWAIAGGQTIVQKVVG